MTKIRTSLLHRANRIVTFGNLGNVKFDENCESEVNSEIVEQIQALDASIELVDSKKIENIKVNGAEEIKAAEKQAVEDTNNSSDDKTIKEEADLSKMTLKQLQEVAKEATLPDAEWNKLNKTQIIAYLEEKLSAE